MTKTDEVFPTLDPIAFFGALVLAPILIALNFFWLLLIPVFALFFGTIPYLVFGTPVLLWMVTRYPLRFRTYAVAGLLAQAIFVFCFSFWESTRPSHSPEMAQFLALWGIPFSAAWCGTFARLYARFYRPVSLNFSSERNA